MLSYDVAYSITLLFTHIAFDVHHTTQHARTRIDLFSHFYAIFFNYIVNLMNHDARRNM